MSADPKFKVGDVWKTRDGQKARIICVDVAGDDPLVALVLPHNYKRERIFRYDKNGNCISFSTPSSTDLIEPWTEPKLRRLAYIHPLCGTVKLLEPQYGPSDGGFIRALWLDEPEDGGST